MWFLSEPPLLRYPICLKILFAKLLKILAPFLLSLIAICLDSHS